MNVIFNGTQTKIKEPNTCPHCHVVNNPHFKWKTSSRDFDNKPVAILVHECSNADCQRVFISLYKRDSQQKVTFKRFLNGRPKGPDWPNPILDLEDGRNTKESSSEKTKFINTYLQSLEAEMNGLDELAGMGYRKAVEYLVKDWAIKNNPDKKEEIIKLWLGQVISKYYTGDLKAILERATWLGNDQAHYNKLFEEYDIDVLKELISLIMVELDRLHKMEHYKETIQKKK